MSEVLLEARDLVKHFPVRRSKDVVHAVDGVSLDVQRGETLGIVGESGCTSRRAGRCGSVASTSRSSRDASYVRSGVRCR